MKLLHRYKNGNCYVRIYDNGSRFIKPIGSSEIKLDYPLNIDIRLMTKCDFGLNPKTSKSVCSFCHESARTDGKECDYSKLLQVLDGLPHGIEIAIGINEFTQDLVDFLQACKGKWILNGTINQGALAKDKNIEYLKYCLDNDLLKGLGVSYRPKMPKIPQFVLDYPHTVVHTIAGIDEFTEVVKLSDLGVKKLLVLGEKDFGFNKGKVDLTTKNHRRWYDHVILLDSFFDVVSFDNLAVKQLDMRRFFDQKTWDRFYQGEHSFYINAVDQYFAPSSRSSVYNIPFDQMSLKDYFQFLETQTIEIKDM